jgi:protein involved in polysaccharide export with SLBB domain
MKDVASTSAAALAQQALRSMFMIKLRTIAVSLVLVGVAAYGVRLAAPQANRDRSPSRSRRPSSGAAQKSNSKAQPSVEPLGDYVVEPPDLILVEVLEALPGRPISGERLVRPDGRISLGFYGDVDVAGLTISRVKEKIIRHVQRFLTDPALGIVETDNETGEPVIDPKTKKPKEIDPKVSATVFVDVSAYNSKNYYVEGEVVVTGRLPVTGKETVLDAVHYAGGLAARADHSNVTLYRLDAKGQLPIPMHVDIDQITLGDDLSTNYQLKPGDRLVVRRKPGAEPDEHETKADGAEDESVAKSRRSAYFDRPDQRRVDRDAPRDPSNRETLLRLEQRMSAVEEKLDEILGALKKRTR